MMRPAMGRLTAQSLRQIRRLFPANRIRALRAIPVMPLGYCNRLMRGGGICKRTLDHPGCCNQELTR